MTETTAALGLLDTAAELGFGELHMKVDAASGLRVIVAIHSTARGPALGGCRLLPYFSDRAAIDDALRLARGMTCKAAVAGLPYGGGKAVIIQPPGQFDRKALLRAYGLFIEQLQGRYITTEDSGTSIADMDVVASVSGHVRGTSKDGVGDPSPWTAMGVRCAIEAAVWQTLQRADLNDVHVAIQGVGHVGYLLARDLRQRGARLSVCDSNPERARRCAIELGADVVAPQAIFDVRADVFAPCGGGAILDDESIARLKVSVVAGAANNQLAEACHGELLHQRGILYAPDFVINAGGLLRVALGDVAQLNERVLAIQGRLTRLFETARAMQLSPAITAERLAAKLLAATPERELASSA